MLSHLKMFRTIQDAIVWKGMSRASQKHIRYLDNSYFFLQIIFLRTLLLVLVLGAFCRSVTFLFSKSQSKFEDIGFNQKLDKVGAACFTSVWLDWPRFGWTSRQEQYAGPSTNSQPALTCVINLWSLKMYKCCNALQWCPLSSVHAPKLQFTSPFSHDGTYPYP